MEQGTKFSGCFERSIFTTIQSTRTSSKGDGNKFDNRELLEIGLRNPVRPINGLLLDPNLYTQRANRDHIVGKFLAEQMCYTRPSIFGRHYRLDDDHTHVIDERRVAQDILRQVHRRVPGHMFRDGLRFATGICHRGVYGQEDTNAEEPFLSYTEDSRTKEGRWPRRARWTLALPQPSLTSWPRSRFNIRPQYTFRTRHPVRTRCSIGARHPLGTRNPSAWTI